MLPSIEASLELPRLGLAAHEQGEVLRRLARLHQPTQLAHKPQLHDPHQLQWASGRGLGQWPVVTVGRVRVVNPIPNSSLTLTLTLTLTHALSLTLIITLTLT